MLRVLTSNNKEKCEGCKAWGRYYVTIVTTAITFNPPDTCYLVLNLDLKKYWEKNLSPLMAKTILGGRTERAISNITEKAAKERSITWIIKESNYHRINKDVGKITEGVDFEYSHKWRKWQEQLDCSNALLYEIVKVMFRYTDQDCICSTPLGIQVSYHKHVCIYNFEGFK